MNAIRITWRARNVPLAPAGVAALGPAAILLARRLLAETDERLANLRGVAGRGILVVLGDESDLPWADGVIYVGADARAGRLLLPTAVEPAEPVELVERALAAQFADAGVPLALLGATGVVVSLAAARIVARETLERWLAAEQASAAEQTSAAEPAFAAEPTHAKKPRLAGEAEA